MSVSRVIANARERGRPYFFFEREKTDFHRQINEYAIREHC